MLAAERRAVRFWRLVSRLVRCEIWPVSFQIIYMVHEAGVFGALIRAVERWRSVKITEFERRQLAAVRQELNQEYETIARPADRFGNRRLGAAVP